MTARVYLQRVGFPFVDLGNLTLVKQEPKIDRAQQNSYSNGRCQVTHEEPGKLDLRWTIKGAEKLGPALQLLNLAKETVVLQTQAIGAGHPDGGNDLYFGWTNVSNFQYTGDVIDEDTPPVLDTDYSVDLVAGVVHLLTSYWIDNDLNFAATVDVPGQPAKTGVTANLGNGVQEGDEKEYALDAFNISNFSIYDAESDADLVEGTDYTVDLKTGMVTLLGYGSAGLLTAHWDQPAQPTKYYVQLSEAFVRGTVKLVLQDEGETGAPGAPREIATFAGEISTSDWGDDDGTKFNEFQLTLAATGAPSVKCRES